MTLKIIRYLGPPQQPHSHSVAAASEGACLSAYQSGEHLSMQGLNHLDQAAFQETYKECKTKYKISLNYDNYIQYWKTGRNEYWYKTAPPVSVVKQLKHSNLRLRLS